MNIASFFRSDNCKHIELDHLSGGMKYKSSNQIRKSGNKFWRLIVIKVNYLYETFEERCIRIVKIEPTAHSLKDQATQVKLHSSGVKDQV